MGIRDRLRRLIRDRGATPEAAELDLLRAVLRPDLDQDRARLFSQVGPDSKLHREVDGGAFRLNLEHTTGDLLVELDRTVRTPWFEVRDAETARRLGFRVEVRAGGFFGALEGRTREGAWPPTWRIDPTDLQQVPVLQMPERDEQAVLRLARWLEQDEALLRRAEVVARHPAAGAAVATLGESGPALPAQYLDFLSVTDGLQVGPVEMLGAQDVYTVDLFGGENWVIGLLSDAVFVIAAPGADEIYTVDHDERDLSRTSVGPSLKKFISDWVARVAE